MPDLARSCGNTHLSAGLCPNFHVKRLCERSRRAGCGRLPIQSATREPYQIFGSKLLGSQPLISDDRSTIMPTSIF